MNIYEEHPERNTTYPLSGDTTTSTSTIPPTTKTKTNNNHKDHHIHYSTKQREIPESKIYLFQNLKYIRLKCES